MVDSKKIRNISKNFNNYKIKQVKLEKKFAFSFFIINQSLSLISKNARQNKHHIFSFFDQRLKAL